MKTLNIVVVVLMLLCVALQVFAQKGKMPEIVMPKEMAPAIAEQNMAAAEKGYALYQVSCSGCHGGSLKGKNAIPDFTITQLEAYQIRIANEKHIDMLDDRSLTSEELSLIITFFMYKKPIGNPFVPKNSNVPKDH